MNHGVTQPTFETMLPLPPDSKLERERRAFFQLLPELLTKYRGQYVALHEGAVVDSGSDRLEVALRVLRRVGNVDIYVGLVSEQPEPVSRSGVRRELPAGDAAS